MAHCLRIGAFIVLIAASAEAQQLAGTFDQLRVLVKSGDTLTITNSTGQRTQGKLTLLSESSLVLDVSGALHPFQAADVDTIEKRGSDSLKNGALIGLGVAGGLGTLAATSVASREEAGLVAIAALLYAGIGAGIGAGIDALIEGRRVIYAGANSNRTTFHISPILSRQGKGVMLSVRLKR